MNCKEVEVSFGEYVSGALPAPGIFPGTSNSRDRGRVRWNCTLIVRAHRELGQLVCDVRVQLGRGVNAVRFLTTDLTAEYVRINADYST